MKAGILDGGFLDGITEFYQITELGRLEFRS